MLIVVRWNETTLDDVKSDGIKMELDSFEHL